MALVARVSVALPYWVLPWLSALLHTRASSTLLPQVVLATPVKPETVAWTSQGCFDATPPAYVFVAGLSLTTTAHPAVAVQQNSERPSVVG